MKLRIFSLLFLGFLFIFVVGVHADSLTDYDFQLAKYRQNYVEFSLFKTDYLQNPTLDNQQKAILSAKQTLQARDLAKAAYAKYLLSSIAAQDSGYAALDPIIARLNNAVTYFTNQSQLSQQIINAPDLKTFTLNYLDSYIQHERALYYGQIALKVATTVRFQINTKNELDAMVPQIPADQPAPLQERLKAIPTLVSQINTIIADITSKIIPESEENLINEANYFEPVSAKLENIKALQLQLIDQLRDIDINYVQSKI